MHADLNQRDRPEPDMEDASESGPELPEHTGRDLGPDEAADALEQPKEHGEAEKQRETSTTDDDQITLDSPD